MLQQLRFIGIAFLGSMLLLTACSDDPLAVNEEAPQLPPTSAMQIDFSTLLGDSSSQQKQATTQAIGYYVQAVYKAGSLESLIESNLSTPRAVLAQAHDTVAVQNENQQWEWSYQVELDSIQYQSRILAERITSSTVNWSVYLSSEQEGLNNTLFFSGTSNANEARGQWAIYPLGNESGSGDPSTTISWQASQKDTTKLTLKILTNANGHLGDSLSYKAATSIREVAYYKAGTDETITIRWDPGTRAGSITTPDVNSGNRACWDAELQNVACSELEMP